MPHFSDFTRSPGKFALKVFRDLSGQVSSKTVGVCFFMIKVMDHVHGTELSNSPVELQLYNTMQCNAMQCNNLLNSPKRGFSELK